MKKISDQQVLMYAREKGIINLDDVRDAMRESEKQRLLNKHKYEIFYDEKDRRWKTTLPDDTKKSKRRLVAKRCKETLEAEIISYYAKKEDEEYEQEYATMTLRKVYNAWIHNKMLESRSASYIKRINSDWKAFYANDEIADKPLRELTVVYLQGWIHKKIRNHAMTRNKYNNMAVILRQALDYACMNGVDFLQENPFTKVKVNKRLFVKKTKPEADTQVYLNSEQELVAKECSAKFQKRPRCITPLMILLNFQLGLRIGELVALKWSDIKNGYIYISRMEVEDYILDEQDGEAVVIPNGYKIVDYTKSDAGIRCLFLNSCALELLKMIKEAGKANGYENEEYIFISSQTHKRGNARTITKYLEKLCESIGILNKSNHKIRKTYISFLLGENISIDTVRRIAGHSDERTTLNNYCFDISDNTELESKLECAKNTKAAFKRVAS